MALIQIWGDGAVKGNGTPEAVAGWGVVMIVKGSLVREFNGHLPAKKYPPYQSNNTGELTAVIQGLKQLDTPYEVEVYTDSEYVILGATRWHKNWIANNWKNSEGQNVANKKLWKELLEVAAKHDIKWVHVKGHTGVEWNERCDELAKAGVRGEIVDHVYNPLEVVLEGVPEYTTVTYEFGDDDELDF